MEEFHYILILLGCAVAVVAFFRHLNLPPILGYLFVGILVGPGGLGLIPSLQEMNLLAEFGVVFLMFTIGLEFSLPQLIATRRTLLSLGGTQVAVCTLVATGVGWLIGLNPTTAFIAAAALALSSTAVVLKQLTEQEELHNPSSRLIISILLFQDLAAVLFIILIPALAGGNNTPLFITLLLALGKGASVVLVLAIIGMWLLRPLFHMVARAHSNELFMLAVLLVALGAAWITDCLELSMALGGFLAGLMLGETEFRHQIEIDIRPFRDVLLGLFFITIGSLLDVRQLPEIWHWVLLLLTGLILLKTAVIMGLIRVLTPVDKNVAFKIGLMLSQGGEFGFVLLTVAIRNDLIDPAQSQILVATLVISIILTPLLVRYKKKISDFFFKPPPQLDQLEPYFKQPLETHTAELKNHVIICGFGRVGQVLSRFLEQEHIPTVALDLDPMRISASSLAGEHAFYGDARRPEVLAAAGLARARMLVISFADEDAALEVLKHVRALRLDIPVFVRTRDDSQLEAFQAAGATEVVPESLEASLMLASHLLVALNVPTSRILYKVRAVQSDRYRMIRGFFKGTDDVALLEDEQDARKGLHIITIAQEAPLVGQTLQEFLDQEPTITIHTLIRQATRYNHPPLDMTIQANDILVIYADPEAVYRVEEIILQGH